MTKINLIMSAAIIILFAILVLVLVDRRNKEAGSQKFLWNKTSVEERVERIVLRVIQSSFNENEQTIRWYYRPESEHIFFSSLAGDDKALDFSYDEIMKLYTSDKSIHKRLGRMLLWKRDHERARNIHTNK